MPYLAIYSQQKHFHYSIVLFGIKKIRRYMYAVTPTIFSLIHMLLRQIKLQWLPITKSYVIFPLIWVVVYAPNNEDLCGKIFSTPLLNSLSIFQKNEQQQIDMIFYYILLVIILTKFASTHNINLLKVHFCSLPSKHQKYIK